MRYRFLLFFVAGLAGCQPEARQAATVVVKDDLGRTLTLPAVPRRVLALAPSMTEMLYAVADTATIVARVPQDDYPAAVRQKPVVNNFPLDLEKLVLLRPDVVFTIEGITSIDDAQRLQELGIPVYYQRYRRVEDVFAGIEKLGSLLSRQPQAQHLADSLRRELKTLADDASRRGMAPKVLAITWQDPIYCYGQNTLFTDEIRLAGGKTPLPKPSRSLTRPSPGSTSSSLTPTCYSAAASRSSTAPFSGTTPSCAASGPTKPAVCIPSRAT
ncbi:ABC transporter substrate-binding protein [Hymenobacter humi]|uniref:ABC transporter substrate-binding protein n=1 Tax=Hymenobacter humi TaxID=1411620 RepID=A0ABW2U739_9BACT